MEMDSSLKAKTESVCIAKGLPEELLSTVHTALQICLPPKKETNAVDTHLLRSGCII